MSKKNSVSETDLGLNSWFRQQGGGAKTVIYTSSAKSFKSSVSSASKSLKLPKLSSNNESKENFQQIQAKKGRKESFETKPEFFSKSFYNASEQTFSACVNKSIASMKSGGCLREEERELCRTPEPNLFYLRCIDDVTRSNQPNKQNFNEPRELKYMQNLPHLKYVTYGCGRLVSSVWKIQICKE